MPQLSLQSPAFKAVSGPSVCISHTPSILHNGNPAFPLMHWALSLYLQPKTRPLLLLPNPDLTVHQGHPHYQLLNPLKHAKSLQLCLNLCNSLDCSLAGSSVHGDSPGKNTGVGCHALLQGIFPTQGTNTHLLPRQAGSLPLVPPEKSASFKSS